MSVGISAVHAENSDKPPRFPQVTMEQLDETQKRVAEEILKVSSAGLGGPYNILLRSPVMADRFLKMADYLRFNTSLPRRLNEFAILIQARLWTSQYEWWAHYPLALKAGLPQAVADELKEGKRPSSMQPDEALVYDFCMELSRTHAVSDATFDKAKEMLGEQQVVDLVTLSGFYVMVSMVLNAGEAGVPNGGAPPLAPISER
jgi:4-carboxymuconolactone decarboxylase